MSYRMSLSILTGMDRETVAHFGNSMDAVAFYQWVVDRMEERIREMVDNHTIQELYSLQSPQGFLLMDLLNYRRQAVENFIDNIKEMEIE
jgi:hypothetical protein